MVQVGGLLGLLVYVWKTWHIARSTEEGAKASASALDEMRRTREEASEPRVVVFFSSANRNFAEIVIENFGVGTAAEVQCSFDPPLQSTMGGNVGQFFASPKWLPPQSRLTHAFDSWTQYFGSALPRRYTVSVMYKDVALKKDFHFTYILDVTAFEHMMRWERKDIHDAAKSLDAIRKHVDDGFSKLRRNLESRDSVWQLTADSADSRSAVAQLVGSWRLFEAMQKAPDAYSVSAHHFAGMRRAASSAMAGAVAEAATPGRQQAIVDVFVALHHHDFDVMTDQGPAMQALADAMAALEQQWSPPSSSRTLPFE